MHILHHAVQNYRNIGQLEFAPAAGVNVICGQNGQGKTNLLESIFLLSGARSFRSGKDADFILRGQEQARIKTRFFCESREQEFVMDITASARSSSLNRGTAKRASAFVGVFRCVLFSPEHLTLVKGTPALRRRFIDTSLCQLKPSYLDELKKYTRLIANKNNLLKTAYSVSAAHDMLDIYDTQLAESAARLTFERRRFLGQLAPLAAEVYGSVSGNREPLSMRYESSLFGDAPPEVDTALDVLARSRADDLRAGFATLGPHRDDLALALAGESARLFASQGQQRTIVLALKLAEAELFEQLAGEKPVLLLDDVFSELDDERKDFLLQRLSGIQSVLTSCEGDSIKKKTGAALFEIAAGRLVTQGE